MICEYGHSLRGSTVFSTIPTVIHREPVGLVVVGVGLYCPVPTAQAVALKYKHIIHMVRMTSMLERDLDR